MATTMPLRAPSARRGYDPPDPPELRAASAICFPPNDPFRSESYAGGLYALAAFALMSAVISALWLRIPNPVRQELASVPADLGQTLQNGRFRPDRGVPFSGRKLQSALVNARQSVDTIKGRISYLFSIH